MSFVTEINPPVPITELLKEVQLGAARLSLYSI